jgi:hypothetical protein
VSKYHRQMALGVPTQYSFSFSVTKIREEKMKKDCFLGYSEEKRIYRSTREE